MNAYTWMVAIVVGLSLIMKGNKKGSKAFIFFAVIAMFCIMGLREATLIGGDSASSYLHGYQKITAMDWETFREEYNGFNVGFFYLMKIVSDLSNGNYQTFIIVISAFIMLCFGHFIKRYSTSPIQSICYYWGLLLYIFMFSAEKQAIAMAILLLAFDAIIDKKPIKFIILVLIASQFHFPALVFLPAYWISRMKVNNGYLILLAIVLATTCVFRDAILKFMLDAYGGDDIGVTMKGITFLRNKVLIMIVIVVAALILRSPTEDDYIYSILLKFMGVAIVFQTFCGYNNIFERLADYYFQFAVVFIPLVFEKNSKVQCKLDAGFANPIKSFAPVVFCGFGIWRFAGYIKACGSLFLPYVFYFNK